MAQYDVDIQLAIRNKNALQGLQRELNAISDAVDAINDKSIDVTGKRRENAIKDLYKNVEDASLKVLEKVDKATTTAHKNQQKVQLKLEDDLFQDKLDKINKLADAEIAASKEANEAALKDFDQRLENRVARRKGSFFGTATAGERAGAAVSAGAFPLLFGGGPGMALGGALGGAISGKTFGPAAIALQVLGGAFDELAAKAASLGQALNPATADVDTLVEALGLMGSSIQDSISSLEELAGEQVALEQATRQLSLVVGDDGVRALEDLGDASTQFGNALTQVTTQVLAQIAKLTGGLVKEIAKNVEFGALLTAAKASDDPRQQALQQQLAGLPIKAGAKGIDPERVRIEAQMVQLQRDIRAEEEGRLQAAVERARAGSVEHTIAKNNLAIAKLEGDLTNDRVYNLERANIFQDARKKLLEEGADVKLIELERDGQLLELANKRNSAIDSANQKAERERRRADRALEKAEKARMREQQDRIDIAEKQRKIELDLEEAYNRQIDKIGNQTDLLRARLEGKEEEVKKQQLINQLVEKYGEDKRAVVELLVDEQLMLEKQITAAEKLDQVYAAIGQSISSGVVDALTAAVEGTKSLADIASQTLRQIANILIRFGVNSLFSGFGGNDGGGFFSKLFPQRALGGPVGSGQPYLVGEKGPELFVPGAQGNIVPNNAMGGSNIVVNVDASGSSVEGDAQQSKALGQALGAAVKAELIKQKMPGGLLA